jgi:membrane protein YqaA with SNARE-associated domain
MQKFRGRAPSTLANHYPMCQAQRSIGQEYVLDAIFAPLFEWLARPSVGLGALFVVSALAATILPLGSEPVFLGYLALNPEFFWVAVMVATAGNSLGGFMTYWMVASALAAVLYFHHCWQVLTVFGARWGAKAFALAIRCIIKDGSP